MKANAVKHATILFTFLLIVWGFYRKLFELPEEVSEGIVKPLIWLAPVFYLVRLEKGNLESVGITLKNLFPSIYLSLGLASLFVGVALAVNFLKYSGFHFSANIGDKLILASLGISFMTAISEELAFRGFIFQRLNVALENEMTANILTSLAWTLIHLPIAILTWNLGFYALISYSFVTFAFGVGAAFLYARTKNIVSPILLHVLWEWPIILFR